MFDMPIRRLLGIIFGVSFLIVAAAIVAAVNYQQRQQAVAEAAEKARIILNHNLAIHTYFSKQLKPAIFQATDPYRSKSYFDPAWMSSTYAVREIDRYYQELFRSGYYYKECAINARSPQNEADEWERAILEEMRRDPSIIFRNSIREINGKPFLTIMRRGESMEGWCLRCHSTPEAAPAEMVSRYGSGRSFNRSDGELVSAVSIRVPLEEAYAATNRISLWLSLVLLSILVLFYGLQYLVLEKGIVRPIDHIAERAALILSDESKLGNQISRRFAGRELNNLTKTFNELSLHLKQDRDSLVEQVQHRTAELEAANRALQLDIVQRKRAEEKLRELSLSDELTGLTNRRGFFILARQQMKVAARVGKGLLLVFADVDRMKWINDTFGHARGDEALLDAAAVLRSTFRTSDIVSRIGGDEFAVLCIEPGEETGESVVDRFRQSLLAKNAEPGRLFTLSVSVGVVAYAPEESKSLEELLEEADTLMYREKQLKAPVG